MTTPLIPPIEELRKLYARQLDNADVHALSCWSEGNHSDPSDDNAYLAKTLREGPALMDKFDNIIAGI